ncbi:iron-uptake system-binding protein [Brevibacillus laterosporus]|uniref:iron-hydroxamate ABC transporter substrate-binding protein n=1 Tax=Brevibacillus laterosporus TaxID=1465 RepID=UPI000C75C4FB|nr:iron-hydroxamate ABC transporter substrate-binding protein [Brevibacillus laterosporus]AUM63340.1 iron-uptake system-binding protein [Brevibacillus laterosporus]
MNKRKFLGVGLVAILALMITACGGKTETTAPANPTATSSDSQKASESATGETRTIKYLDQEYKVPAKTDRIVITGSMESMEDAVVLGVEPVGAISVGGKFPDIYKSITGSSESIGEKMQPNLETMLKLKPDVILGSSKFKPEVYSKFEKIAPTFPVSHISSNWEANLHLLAELTGKQAEAENVLKKYKEDLEKAKASLSDKLKDKKVVAIRLRQGTINIYPEKVFFNPSLYAELGFTAPEEVKAAKAQEAMSLEKFSAMNPDYIFVQFSPDENKDQPKSLEDLEKNPIWQSINAVKNGHVYVNVVDPLGQGGTAWSKINFLKAAVEKLSK